MPVAKDGTAYALSGPEDAPVAVLIHGIGLNRAAVWAPVERWLAGRFRVLSYDLPGHGDSAVPEGEVTLTTLSRQLISLLDELGIAKAALVGFSIGGMINRRVAMDAPDRVSALVILNSPHERGDEMQSAVEAQARASADGAAATMQTTLERWFTPEYRRDNRALVGEVEAVVRSAHAESFAAHRIVLADGVKELIRPEPPIAMPTLVMTCENDERSTPEMSAAIASEIEGAELEIVPGLKHLGLVERPMLFGQKIERFLEKVLA
ncbi:alpha/beta fold hydrolase [Roseovarius faecimaris]|uniref:Alpha/beta fold hydrolase n=1 Tax=Roseovarius faecimaris TaxID=2494550 RepID=A0A6I6IRS1_9RHOB|nr:alpha/beta fold hydrolase [Roseovarius faecimaris]QGX98267.1 alpha/beta fold hydrolase [Roseovarius faecimaris]